VEFRLTSLRPIRPENIADPWERQALERFERGEVETTGVEHGPKGEMLRYMAPLKVQESCLACHARQGYKLGDVRGGISVTQRFAPIEATTRAGIRQTSLAHAAAFAVVFLGGWALLEALRAVDPESAARLHLRDEKRIVRALEVYYETGETIGAHDRKSREIPPRYDAAYIGLAFRDREDMKERIDRRVDAMVAQGLLQEVETLLQSGLPRDATALQAIGYKQFLAVAEGRATTAEAIEEVKLRSRQYAKRQLTWLRRNEAIHWILWEKTPDFSAGLQNATEFLLSAGVC
jgi:hypothetical protein